MRNVFGWSYPPGCSGPPDDGPEVCDCCGVTNLDKCVCPECPECGGCGDPDCYKRHGLIYTFAQLRGQATLAVQERKAVEAESAFWAQFEEEKEIKMARINGDKK